MLTACDRLGIVCRHDFLGILEPYMMEEKKGLVDFLRTAVGCFRDLPRGHIISLAQHMQQVLLLIMLGLCCAVLHCAVLCCAVLDCAVLSCICYVYAAQYMLCCACCVCCAVHAMQCMVCHPVHTTKARCCVLLYGFKSVFEKMGNLSSHHT